MGFEGIGIHVLAITNKRLAKGLPVGLSDESVSLLGVGEVTRSVNPMTLVGSGGCQKSSEKSAAISRTSRNATLGQKSTLGLTGNEGCELGGCLVWILTS